MDALYILWSNSTYLTHPQSAVHAVEIVYFENMATLLLKMLHFLSFILFCFFEMRNETLFSNSVTMICRTVLKSLAITADAHFKLKNYEANRIKLQKTRPMLNFWELLLPYSKIYTSIILLCDINLLLHLENIWIFECEDYFGL